MPDINCEKQSLIQEFLDSPDSIKIKSELDKHLAECQKCRGDFQQYQKMFQSLDHFLKPPFSKPSLLQLEKIRKVVAPKSLLKKSESDSLVQKLLSFLLQPALVTVIVVLAVGVLFVATRKKPEISVKNPVVALEKLDFSKNRVEIIFNQTGKLARADEKPLQLEEIHKFALETQYALPADAVVQLISGPNKIILSKAAEFRLGNNSFELRRGQADLKLAGRHDEFKLISDFAEVSVLGTEFVAEISNSHLKIALQSGSVLVKTSNGSVMKLEQPGATVIVDQAGKFQKVKQLVDEKKALPVNDHTGSDKVKDNPGHSGHKLENSF